MAYSTDQLNVLPPGAQTPLRLDIDPEMTDDQLYSLRKPGAILMKEAPGIALGGNPGTSSLTIPECLSNKLTTQTIRTRVIVSPETSPS